MKAKTPKAKNHKPKSPIDNCEIMYMSSKGTLVTITDIDLHGVLYISCKESKIRLIGVGIGSIVKMVRKEKEIARKAGRLISPSKKSK